MTTLKDVVASEIRQAAESKIERIAAAGRTIAALQSRGLLRKQKYHAPTSGEFERLYAGRRERLR